VVVEVTKEHAQRPRIEKNATSIPLWVITTSHQVGPSKILEEDKVQTIVAHG
jgi:hypothetical protein